jgi:large subunit ribosomal protein L21
LELCLAWILPASARQQRRISVYAIIKSGGRQLKVVPGTTVTVDRVDAQPGDEVSLSEILLVEKDGGEVLAGAPFVPGAKVLAVVEGETRGPKIRVFKKKRRKGMRRTKGHRSTYTTVRITGIDA